MKKYLLLIGAVLLVLAFVSPCMAQPANEFYTPPPAPPGGPAIGMTTPLPMQFRTWGYLEFHSIFAEKPDFGQGTLAFGGSATYKSSTGTASINSSGLSNPAPFGYVTPTPAASGYAATAIAIPTTHVNVGETVIWRKWAERMRFWLQYGDPKTVRGVVGFEMDSDNIGEAPWTAADATTLSASGNQTSSNPSGRLGMINGDQVQLEIKHAFVDLMVPSTPVMLTIGLQGYVYGGIFGMARDVPGITATVNFAPYMVRGGVYRFRDVDELKDNVADTYWVEGQLNQKAFNGWAYFAYFNDLSHSTAFPIGALGTGNTYVGIAPPAAAGAYDDHPWWIGLGGQFRPGNWLFNGEFTYNGGKRVFKQNSPTVVDQTYDGYAAELMAQYRIGPGLFARLEANYTTGINNDKTNKITKFNFQSGSEMQWSFGNGRSVFFYMNGDVGFYEAHTLDYTGMWFGRGNAEYDPFSWLSLNFNYLYIGNSSNGTPGAGKYVNSPNFNGAQQVKRESYVGSEMNVIARIKIYDNVQYGIGVGYFLPGPVFDLYNTAGQKIRSPDNAWCIHSRLMCAF